MSAPNYSDSPGRPTNYLGQSYRFSPVYIRERDPHNGTDGTPFTSPDIKPKENQGYYPVGSFWVNLTLNRLWVCTSFGLDTNSKTCAHWELMESAGITGTEQFNLPDASTITPTGVPPTVTFENGAGISITQGSSSHAILITNTGAGNETLTGNDAVAVSPTAGTIRLLGVVVAAGTQASAILTKAGGGNLENINVQVSSAIAATDITKVGLAAFKSSQFSVDANGFVSFIGSVGLLTWNTVSVNTATDVNNGYICISPGGALTMSLPAASTKGDMLEITLDGATSFQVTQGAGQQIRFANSQTTAGAGGSLTTTNQGDSLRMVCQTANLKWNVLSSIGTFTVI
jgi:hypothetical protein